MYDLIILGGGPGGYVAAEQAAHTGMKVALIEKDALGGTCLNRGCIPTKSLLNAAKIYKHAQHGAALGVKTSDISFDLATAMSWKNATVTRLVANIDFLLKKSNVTIIKGQGRLTGPNSLTIAETGETLEARNIIIATGSIPARPPIPGSKDNPAVITSDELLSIETLPASLVVIGGGVIGLEFASFFSTIGVKVTVIEMLPEILPFMDSEAVGVFKRSLKGIDIKTGTAVERIENGTVYFSKDGVNDKVESDLILLATGRRPAVENIGLEDAGVIFSPKGIVVDENCSTNIPSIRAIGDVNGRSLLAHSASAMGRAVIRQLAGEDVKIPWQYFPWVVYGEPEIAGVGMTEADVQKAGLDYAKAAIPARANGRFLAEQGMTAHGLCKLLLEKTSHRILGAHIVSPYAGEMIWGMQYALSRGATLADLEQTVFPHPTIGELFHDTAGALSASL